ncbi:MAG: efflux RND transporter periplasmic adaptor subunit [Myxococcales bacterium]|nr:efflux RND transporter periplasmic adaptor subunit [Myxococcales bacterium]
MRCLLLLTSLLVACGRSESTEHDHPHPHEQATQLYTCSMHPQVLQPEPGSCPICGMDLTPVKASEEEEETEDSFVRIAPGVVQQMGVKTAPVERTEVYRHVRTVGEVEVGEDEVEVVNLRFSGWVEGLVVDTTGDEVKAGQTLFRIYSPELVAAQEELLLALRTQGADGALTRSARRKLELWDVSSRDILRIEESGEASRTIAVRAPRSGFVLHKDVVEGARVKAGQDLYRIGNLKRIWVTAEIYEHDVPWVEVGQPAQMELTHLAGRPVQGRVAYVYPTLDEHTRTLPVRLEFDNPGVRLKPGMFATVTIRHRQQRDVTAVPTQAVLHSGQRQLVFVAHGRGRFEPREIRTGLAGDNRMTEVTEGLAVGEVVATSGQFLIDSESQLQEALQKVLAGNEPTP